MDLSILKTLTPEQKEVVTKILKDTLEKNKSEELNELLATDYEQIPVDIDTFMTDGQYMGKYTNFGRNLKYRKWPETLRDWFPNPLAPSPYTEIAITGCITGDTKIPLLNGTNPTILELYNKHKGDLRNNGKDVIEYLYSYDVNENKYTVGELVAVFYTGKKEVYKITFDNGESVTCSAEHPFMTRDKHWKSINSGLKVGDSLMPFNRFIDEKGYENINHPQKDGTYISERTHKFCMRYKIGEFKGVTHHKDFIKTNNSPGNLLKSTWVEHRKYHQKQCKRHLIQYIDYQLENGIITQEEYERKKKIRIETQRKRTINGLKSRWSDPEQHKRTSEKSTEYFNTHSGFASKISKAHWDKIPKKERAEYMKEHKIGCMGPKFNSELHPNLIKITKEELIEILKKCYCLSDLRNFLDISKGATRSLMERFDIDPEKYFMKSSVDFSDPKIKRTLKIWKECYDKYGDIQLKYLKKLGRRSSNKRIQMIIDKHFNGDKQLVLDFLKNYNHKIISIEKLGIEDTYDLTVKNHHNFALNCGVVSKNSTRIGKSVNAAYAGCYFLHRLMCLKDPNSFYGQPGATLWFCFYNNTLDSALDTAYGTFQKMLQSSSWFMERGIVTGTKNLIYKPKKDIEFMVGSELQHTLGRNIIWAMADEVSFKKGKNAEVEKSKMWEMYTSILARIMGSYMINGRSAGQIFLVSSKQSEFDFLERYIEKKTVENNRKPVSERTFYRFDYPQWEIHPASEYPSGKKFKIACGNALLANKIIEPEEDTEENIIALQQKGYRIVEPPIELYDMAKMDLERFLTDQAGIASTINSKFLHYSLYEQCVQDEIPDPFEKEILVIGLKDKLRIRDYFHPEALGYDLVHKKIYVHIDTSLSGDRTGISAVALLGYKDQSRLNESGLTETMNELIYRQLFTVGIQAPKGDQISFRKTREFIFYLVRELNWNIQIVTCDGFQSAQLRQDLYTAGINKDVKNSYITLDKSPEGYDTFKLALQEKRIHLMRRPSNSVFVTEFINLEKDNMTGKVDHPIDGCFTGDTKIRLVDGRSLSINELLLEQQYKDNYVYTFNEEKKRIEPKRIKKVFQTKLTKNLLEVTLDNGQKVLCTPEHRFMLRDGTYKEIKDIEPGTSLMPLYTKYPSEDKRLHKYRLYYEPVEEKWHFEHRSFCKNIIHKKGYVVHHKNYNKNDNTPKNLDCMTTSKHIRLHNNKTKNYKVVSEKVKEWHKRIEGTPEGIAMHKKHGKTWSEKRKDGSHSKKKQAREQRIREIKEIFNVDYLKLTPSERGIYSNKLASLKDPELNKRKASYKEETHKNLHLIHHTKCWITNGIENRYINKTDKVPEGFYRGRVTEWVKDRVITEETRLKMSKKAKKSNIGKVWITNGEIDRFVPKDTILSDSFYYGRSCFKKEYKNHKIISIKQITKPCRVYDLEIEDNHNFALDVGIFVHNSKDLCDSLAGAVFSASKFLKTEDISQLDNYSVLLEANKEEVVVNSNTTLANSLFNGFKKEQKSEADIQNEKIDKELQVIKQLRKNLDPEDKNVTDQQLLDLYNNSFDGDDMLLF